jgi:hypothetical protein
MTVLCSHRTYKLKMLTTKFEKFHTYSFNPTLLKKSLSSRFQARADPARVGQAPDFVLVLLGGGVRPTGRRRPADNSPTTRARAVRATAQTGEVRPP